MSLLSYNMTRFDLPDGFHRARAARQAALVSVLAIATEKKLPIAPLLDAFADDSRSRWRHQIRDLSDMLQSGVSLPDALEAIPGLLPDDVVLAVRVGAESGTHAAALKMAAARLSPRGTASRSSLTGAAIYLTVLTSVVLLLVSFLMIYIVPKFAKIFDDFGVELPTPTTLLIDASRFAGTYGLLMILFVCTLYILVASIIDLSALSIRFSVPIDAPARLLRRLLPPMATGGILRNLSLAIAAGRPLIGPLSTMAGSHPDRSIRRRIGNVADDVERGSDCWESLRREGLINRREAAILTAAARAGNLDWALRQTGDNADSRMSFRLAAAAEFVRPLLILLYAAIVGAVVVALFLPLIKLMTEIV